MFIINTLVNVTTQQSLLLKKTLLHAHDISSLLNESSTNYLDEYNIGKLRLLLSDVATNPNVIYCYIFDENGAILTDGTTENSLRDQVLPDPISIKSIATKTTLLQTHNEILDVTSPIYLGKVKLGGVRIGFSLASLEQEKQQIIYQNIQLSVLFFFISLIVLFWIAKRITRPLISFTENIASFDISNDKKMTNSQRRDEIGELSREFNKLIDKLRHTTASKHQLDQEVAIRIATEKKLRAAVKEANIAVEAKSEFLANMSHEIRTPMNGVLGMLGLLLDDNLDEEQYHRAEVAKSSADSLLMLINDILDFSKIDAGKLELEHIDFNLRALIDGLAESMVLQAQEKGVELILDLSQIEYSMIKSDPGRLRQILTNLLGNAIKFTHGGEIVITVELLNEGSNPGKELTLYCKVEDTGIGIPKDKLAVLFETFSQVDSSTTRKYGGTGLGLSITKKLCQLMGGEIQVTSEEGKGSCFEFQLSIGKSSHSTLVIPDVDISNLHILIVDDNATNRNVLTAQLARWGAKVAVADSGQNALGLCKERALCQDLPFFDIALLDMQMPTMDGKTLGKIIRAHNAYKKMKLVIMTSVGNRGDAKYFSELGFSAYFPKPTTTTDLFKALCVIADDGEALQQATPLVTKHYLNEVPATEQQAPYHNDKILLVEDNRVNQMVALAVLKKIGLQADIAGNGIEALKALERAINNNFPYALVIMDCQMPKMDGYQATRCIRLGEAGEECKQIPIIAMTANAMQGDKEKCLLAGMSDYLSKPINLIELQKKLIHWLPKHNNQLEQSQSCSAALHRDNKATVTTDKSENDDTIWQQSILLERVAGNKKQMLMVIECYLENTADQISTLSNSIASDDIETIYNNLQAMKGSVGNVGGIELHYLTTLMGESIKNNDLAKVSRHMTEINQATLRLNKLLTNFYQKHSSVYSE